MSYADELKQAKLEARLHRAKKKLPTRKPPTLRAEAQPQPTAKADARLRRLQLTISRQFASGRR